jgi:CheY-like chemotaxis protein
MPGWLAASSPDDKPPNPSECAPKDNADIVPPLRVLVIEDHRDTAEAIAACLRVAGHAVEVASTGEAGLELARQMQPHVVFCDIWLPGLDGYFVLRALRSDPAIANCYCVAMSGVPFREGHDVRVDEYLTKPVDAEALLAVMKRAAGS